MLKLFGEMPGVQSSRRGAFLVSVVPVMLTSAMPETKACGSLLFRAVMMALGMTCRCAGANVASLVRI